MNAQIYTAINALAEKRGSQVLVYITGDRRGMEAQISTEVFDYFTRHLDSIGDIKKISLYLYTRGGETLAGWSIVNLIRQFCENFEVIVPAKAHSTGTLICLAADNILMTKQATLGPIDPSVNTHLNPTIPGMPGNQKIPVSVEDVNAYIDFARSINKLPETLNSALSKLSDSIHPIVLGNAFRARTQIQMLARKLMAKTKHHSDAATVEKILKFLCSESGSHDYTINRNEAKEELKLPIEKPNHEQYILIKNLYDLISHEMQFSVPYDPNAYIGTNQSSPYCFKRALICSERGGADIFISEGQLVRQTVPTPQGPMGALQDQRTFEGWRHFNV